MVARRGGGGGQSRGKGNNWQTNHPTSVDMGTNVWGVAGILHYISKNMQQSWGCPVLTVFIGGPFTCHTGCHGEQCP